MPRRRPPGRHVVLPLYRRAASFLQTTAGRGGCSLYLDLLEIQADRNDGKGYLPLAFDPTPDYTDPTPAKWTYRAIYRVGEVQVGQWSSPVSIMVGL